MPSRSQLEAATRQVDIARETYRGRLVIDYVVPDYYAQQPKSCMGGWGRQFLNITPSGKVLPCHAAETIPGLQFDSVAHRPLSHIGNIRRPFSASVVLTGCLSPAAVAISVKLIGAVAGARHLP